MKARAYAKINLGLEVLCRRSDGYHEIRTMLQTVDMYDRMSFQARECGVELVTDDPELPKDERNLVVRAARLLAEEVEETRGVYIELEKTIPAGRGLGGGSSDAAMTLLALNELWQAGLSGLDLCRLAARIGMDVPFFLVGGTALGIGRGEEIYPLECQPEVPIVLILPDFAIATAEAYGNLILTKREPSLKLRDLALSYLGGRKELLDLVNDLEFATLDYTPAIHKYKEQLVELGASLSLMSGSGSAVFGIFDDEALARSAAARLETDGIRAIATRTLNRRAYKERRLEFRPRHFGES
jgi:4-diphosphocytidyl-2-C-methyl-D-erythritol kinase